MERIRIPRTLAQYSETLQNPRYRDLFHINGLPCYRGYINGGNEVGEAVIFMSSTLENLLASAQELHIDGTFNCRPLRPYTKQLLIIMAIYMDQPYPVAYVLMTKKTKAAYLSVFQYINDIIPGNIEATNVLTDYEVKLGSAFKQIFPNANQQNSWSYMRKELEQKASKIGILHRAYADDIALHNMLRMSMSLALLPAKFIVEGFNVVKRQANLSPNRDVSSRFVNYFQTQWIDRFGVDNISVYKKPRRTTYNPIYFHRLLTQSIDDHRPGIWSFTKSLMKMNATFSNRYERQLIYPILRPRCRKFLIFDRNVKLATETLEQGRITAEEFLRFTYNLSDPDHGQNRVIFPPQLLKDMRIVEVPRQADQNPVIEEQRRNDDNGPQAPVVDGLNLQELIMRQRHEHELLRAQRNENNELLIGNEQDFVLPEETDPIYLEIALIDRERMVQEREEIPFVPLDMAGIQPRRDNCCVICLANNNSHACIPCGHKCLCEMCTSMMSGKRCPICNRKTELIMRIYENL